MALNLVVVHLKTIHASLLTFLDVDSMKLRSLTIRKKCCLSVCINCERSFSGAAVRGWRKPGAAVAS